MKDTLGLLALPASLLVFVLGRGVHSHALLPPNDSSPKADSLLEDGVYFKREVEEQSGMAYGIPIGLRKMGDDPGEKFFMHYWDFGERQTEGYNMDHERRQQVESDAEEYQNITRASMLSSPFLPHANDIGMLSRLLGRNVFGRDFQCPANTFSCSSVGESDLCCPTGQTCVNTPSGVGCCPSGATCGDTVASCDTGAGYTSCPNSNNGGCCVPGASCSGSGCVFFGTETVTTTLPTKTVVTGVSTISHSTPDTSTPSTSSPQVIVSGYTTTATVTISGQGTTQTMTVLVPTTIVLSDPSTTTSTTSSSSTDPTDSTTSTTTVTPSAPVRGTSVDPSSQSTVTAADITSSAGCPTGFYMCSAVYQGGCCRVDRNCDSTTCPAADSTAAVGTGITVLAPSASGTGGSCASGWSSCAASAGGGCCPSGYICGASCTATVSGVSNQPKATPSSAHVDVIAWSFFLFGLGTVMGMLWL